MSAHYDLFPAFVNIAPPQDPTPLTEVSSGPPRPNTGRFYDKARVIVSSNMVTIAVDGDNGPKIVLQEKYASATFQKSANRSQDSYLETLLGFKIAFKRNDACGCGSRLRSWNPYRTLNSKFDPTE